MKKIFTLIVVCLTTISTWAYDAKIDGIYYFLNASNKLAGVTFGNNDFNSYSGDVVIPETVTYNDVTYSVNSIAYYAFKSCPNLTSVTIPNSMTVIGSNAFEGCTGLSSISIPNSVTSIGFGAFSGCTGLTSAVIGNSVTSLDDGAFSGCSGLTSITIPNSVTTIGNGAFKNCSSLASVTIPGSVTSIDTEVFSGCTSLGQIVVDSSNSKYNDGNKSNCIIETETTTLVCGCKNTTIPDFVTAIEKNAFINCTGLTTITIPNSVTSIGQNAFDSCTGLMSVDIPNSVTSIGQYAFQYCTSLTSLTIGNSVKSIGNGAFLFCSGLASINIPNSVTSIGNGAFGDCTSLTSIAIPSSVTSIGDAAFSDCSALTSATFHNYGLTIGHQVFDQCYKLTDINIMLKDELDFINYLSRTDLVKFSCLAIYSGNQKRNIYINGCKQTSFSIPTSVKSIGASAFEFCSDLTSVTIPNSVTSIGNAAFCECKNLTTINIPNSVTNIEEEAFVSSGLITIDIPNSVTSIEYSTFHDCSHLTTVTIPSSVTNIAQYAFFNCQGLTSVTCAATSVPTTNSKAFQSVNLSNITLYVPDASIDDYKSTAPWSGFGTIMTIESNKCATPTISYEDKHLKYSTETEGAEIVSTITVADAKTSHETDVELTATYNITAYATLNGKVDSDVATATLVWATGTLNPDGINEAKVISVDALPLLISQEQGMVTVSGLSDGDTITAYGTDGKQVAMTKAAGNAALLNLSDLRGKVAVLSVNGRSAKVMIK